MFWHSSFNKQLSLLAIPFLLLLAQGGMQAAPLTVMSSVSPEGMNYLYDFAITNQTSADPYYNLISVDFSLPSGTVVGMATAPMGNGESTDPSGDFVEFTSNNVSGFPVGTAVDGFQFVSAAQFSSFSFTANYLNSAEMMLSPVTETTWPQGPTSVPEPSTLSLLGGALLLLVGRLRFRTAR